jgi:hypothetical protein
MNSLTKGMSVDSRGALLQRLFKICYLVAVAVAMFGWLSAFWWISVQVVRWLITQCKYSASPQPIIIQSAKFTSNAIPIARLPF